MRSPVDEAKDRCLRNGTREQATDSRGHLLAEFRREGNQLKSAIYRVSGNHKNQFTYRN